MSRDVSFRWSKFTRAVESLVSATPADPRDQALYDIAKNILQTSQRFYLPNGAGILEGRLFDAPTKQLIRLPFDAISVLTEDFINETGEVSWTISLAVDIHGPSNWRHKIVNPETCSDRSFAMLQINETPPGHEWRTRFPHLTWGLLPIVLIVDLSAESGIGISFSDEQSARVLAEQGLLDENIVCSLNAVSNLCALLNLKNISSVPVLPPSALNKKRAERGKLPLYDYHVLKVDQEGEWHSPFVSLESGSGYRSHLRRGHIRRLHDDRHIWVRATYVHGGRSGFVDKDYEVANN